MTQGQDSGSRIQDSGKNFYCLNPESWILNPRYRWLVAFLLGISATLTLPPFYIFPLVVPAYGGLFWLLNHALSRKRAAILGFFWGWGFFMSGLYWFTIALLTEPEKFAWAIPLALFALTAVIALYTTVFSALYFSVRRAGMRGAIIFATLWTVMEYARGHLFTGFPWNLGGYVFAGSNASIQLASLAGIYGLTFAAVLVGVSCVASKRGAIVCLLLLVTGIGWGAWRAETAPHEFADNVVLRLVQANIQQHHKWNPAKQMQGLMTHMDMTQRPGQGRITHVIWPETAVPYLLQDDSTLSVRLGQIMMPGQYLITGALRENEGLITNSIVALNAEGQVVGQYDKFKLVPFGEFLPLRWMLPDAITTPVGMRDLDAGAGPKTLEWPGLPPVSPLICYEVIFPGLAVNKHERPQWLLSITNDAWFGNSTAPYQHLAMARMRAVEQGLPMVRAANTGISAVFDAYGREIGRIPLGEEAVLDIVLPKPSRNGTIYTRLFYPE